MTAGEKTTLLAWALSSPRSKTPLISGQKLESCLIELLTWSGKQSGLEFSRRAKELGPDAQSAIFSGVNARRAALGANVLSYRQPKLLSDDLSTVTTAASFGLARVCHSQLSVGEKKIWIGSGLEDGSFAALSTMTPFLDECLDLVLGMDEREVKREVAKRKVLPRGYEIHDVYLSHHPEDLFTPYRVIQAMLENLRIQPNESVIDLGSGLGRLGVYLAIRCPGVDFTGYELMEERHAQAVRCHRELKLPANIRFFCQDLAANEFEIPFADVYFMFNPFSRPALQRVFTKLRKTKETSKKKIRLVMVNVGRPPRWVSREPWLTLRYVSPEDEHWEGKGFSIYEAGVKRLSRPS